MLQFVVKTLRGLDTSEDEIAAQAVDQLIRVYDQRLQGISSTSEKQVEAQLDRKYREVARRLRVAQRRELNRLRNQGRFREATLRRLERELDLMELRWGD
jgi:CPA1 family monovalent cation:H+ antiporter